MVLSYCSWLNATTLSL
uniref:Uncharacterized protein n=1 Tax=Anguilla anguilla TaxID=7936 RepID=A0A0E9VP59_ANGAN